MYQQCITCVSIVYQLRRVHIEDIVMNTPRHSLDSLEETLDTDLLDRMSNAEGRVIYVLSNSSVYKKIDDALLLKYKQALRGERPTRVTLMPRYFEICFSMYKLEVALTDKACIPCEGNPYKLLCKCKSGRKIGMCSHILAGTHAHVH